MSEAERRRKYRYNHVLIESARILDPQFSDAVVFLSGAQVELLRNVTQYLNRQDTYVAAYEGHYYLTPTDENFDSIQAIVADLEETLMGNPNTIWGYKEQVHNDLGGIKSGDGDYDTWVGGPEAGLIYVVEAISLHNKTGSRGMVTLWVDTATSNHPLKVEATPGTIPVIWTGRMVVESNGSIHATQEACLNGDDIEVMTLGYTMVVPE